MAEVIVTKYVLLGGVSQRTETETLLSGEYWTPSLHTPDAPASSLLTSIWSEGADYTSGSMLCPDHDFNVLYYFDVAIQVTKYVKLDDAMYGTASYELVLANAAYNPYVHQPQVVFHDSNISLLHVTYVESSTSEYDIGTDFVTPDNDFVLCFYYNHYVNAYKTTTLNDVEQGSEVDTKLWTNGQYTPKNHIPSIVQSDWILVDILYDNRSVLDSIITVPNNDMYLIYKYIDENGSIWIYYNNKWVRAIPWIWCQTSTESSARWHKANAWLYTTEWKRGINS